MLLPTVTWGTYDWNEKHTLEKTLTLVEDSSCKSQSNSMKWFEELLVRLEKKDVNYHPQYYLNPLKQSPLENTINWHQLPAGIHPRDGLLDVERANRKRQQVENLAAFLKTILRDGDIVVEFCAGSGYVALPLACCFPNCHFILVDKKKKSLDIARDRIENSQLQNVSIFLGLVDDFNGRFDVGIALHACGEATDMVQVKCLQHQASYVLAPCCVGKVQHSSLVYPRSTMYKNALCTKEYQIFAKAADFGHSDISFRNTINMKRLKCKSFLERDRNLLAEQEGYVTWMFVMFPRTITPKNDILVGIPKDYQSRVEAMKRSMKDENVQLWQSAME